MSFVLGGVTSWKDVTYPDMWRSSHVRSGITWSRELPGMLPQATLPGRHRNITLFWIQKRKQREQNTKRCAGFKHPRRKSIWEITHGHSTPPAAALRLIDNSKDWSGGGDGALPGPNLCHLRRSFLKRQCTWSSSE